jgi:hypothetical protein
MRFRLPRALLRVSLVAGLALLTTACGGKTGPKEVFPVKGQVLVDGKPASYATVIFHPVGESGPEVVKPRAQVDGDGKFTLSTYGSNDGAPAGDYSVTVEWWLSPGVGTARGSDQAPINRLPVRYASATSSGLKATIGEGGAELNVFRLTRR